MVDITYDPTPAPKQIRKRRSDSIRAELHMKEKVIGQLGIPIGPWNGTMQPYHCVCKRGHNCYPRPVHIINAKKGICRECGYIDRSDTINAKLKTEKMVREQNGIPVGPFRGSNRPYHIICKRNHHSYPVPSSIINRRTGICWQCKTAIAFEETLIRLELIGAEWAGDEWRGMKNSYLVFCADGHECYPWANSIQQGMGICKDCAWTDQNIFYVLQAEDSIKFGITSGNSKFRLGTHLRNGYGTVIRLFTDLSPGIASEIETKCTRTLPAMGHYPIHGREYFKLDALSTLLKIVDAENI